MSEFERPLFSLFRVGVSIQRINKRSEERLGVSLVQWCILRRLIDMPGISAYSLAEAVDVHPSTLTQTLKRLERKGHIFIAGDPSDSRKKVIFLTRAGKETLDRASERLRNWSHELSKFGGELSRVHSFLQDRLSQDV